MKLVTLTMMLFLFSWTWPACLPFSVESFCADNSCTDTDDTSGDDDSDSETRGTVESLKDSSSAMADKQNLFDRVTYCRNHDCFNPVPTGQFKCYDAASVEETCPGTVEACGETPFCGQDAQYDDRERLFTQDENDTVFDPVSGLTWDRSFGYYSSIDHADTQCSEFHNQINYGGLDNWRLPNLDELLTVVSYGGGEFPDPFGYDYGYGSHRFVAFTQQSWYGSRWWALELEDGTLGHQYGTSVLARCVRGDAPKFPDRSDRFEFLSIGDEEIIGDLAAGLVWSDYWTNQTWKNALETCESLEYAGLSDWRLPNLNELGSLVNFEIHGPASDLAQIAVGDNFAYWTSTTYADDPSRAWTIDFDKGLRQTADKRSKAYRYPRTRCVRNMKGTI